MPSDDKKTPSRMLGMFSGFGLKLPLQERLRLIKSAGFDATTLWWGDPEHSDSALHQAPAMVRDAGLFLENIHVPYDGCADIWSQSSSLRAHIARRYQRWIEDCHRHEIPVLVTHISRGSAAEGPNSAGLELVSELAQMAEAAGAVIALENTRRADYLEALFKAVDSPAIGFCFDTSHNWLWTRQAHLLRDFGHRLAATHFSDTRGALDRHWLPGEGELDWYAIAEDFPGAYAGCLTLEVVPKHRIEAEAEAFTRAAYRQAQWIRNQMPGPARP